MVSSSAVVLSFIITFHACLVTDMALVRSRWLQLLSNGFGSEDAGNGVYDIGSLRSLVLSVAQKVVCYAIDKAQAALLLPTIGKGVDGCVGARVRLAVRASSLITVQAGYVGNAGLAPCRAKGCAVYFVSTAKRASSLRPPLAKSQRASLGDNRNIFSI